MWELDASQIVWLLIYIYFFSIDFTKFSIDYLVQMLKIDKSGDNNYYIVTVYLYGRVLYLNRCETSAKLLNNTRGMFITVGLDITTTVGRIKWPENMVITRTMSTTQYYIISPSNHPALPLQQFYSIKMVFYFYFETRLSI